ncbi:serine/threonine-protein kinase [Sorangium atrum]|uniref:Protein kinase n=1 Tax=Sorangium atrum TaxID=2995308 RepID=A0ABT5BR15_9BACT|nr:serine/threonine-protein kinase [Sorangium aterium]MDC0676143.1 protein kinase [Sorangium aterium]
MNSLAEGSVVAGRYRLERTLARGGMGAIWVARHLQLDATVAVKLMAPEYAASSTARARFEREARAAAQLKIPNVVHVHDYGVEGDTPFLVMELLDGEDLETRLSREGRLSMAATLGIVTQVCKALRRAHEMGIVHRDLKPANLFLSRQDEDELVKVLDFGIAKAHGTLLAGNETKTGTLVGSPYYMSPEQVRRSKTLDWRSDLWSVGVIAYRCLTGGLPFPGEEIGEVFVAICTEDAPLASSVVPELGPDVDGFFSRALARDPAHRFQGASELAEAFGAAASAARSETRRLQPSVPAEGPSPLLAVRGGTMAASPDAIGVRPDAIGARPDAIGARPDATGARPDAASPGMMGPSPGTMGAASSASVPTLPNQAGPPLHGSPRGGASEGVAPAFQGAVSTLTSAGNTLAPTKADSRRAWISLALGASALALGLVIYAVLRAPAPGGEPTSPPDPAASPASASALPAAAPSTASPEPAPPPSHSAPAAPGAPSASEAPTSAPAPLAPSSSARKRAPLPQRPRIPRDDPTDHM